MKKSRLSIFLIFGLISATVTAEVTTIAELPDRFNDAISISKSGKIFVSNAGRFGPNGLLGSQVFSYHQESGANVFMDGLSGPLGNAFDKAGNLYVSNMNTGDIFRHSKHGTVEHFATIEGGGGIAIDPNNTLYVASYTSGKIYRVDRRGHAEVFSEHPLLAGGPVGISFDDHHNLYVGTYDDGKVLKIDRCGQVTEIASLDIAGNNIGYLVYAKGNIYTTSLNTNKIYKVSLTGEVSEFAGSGQYGSDDGDNMQATFLLPNGITTNKHQDTLYITEYYSPYVRAISLD